MSCIPELLNAEEVASHSVLQALLPAPEICSGYSSMGSNETWLRQQLSAALGWDDVIMEGVMDVIVNSKSEADIQDVVEVCLQQLLSSCGC